MDAIKVNVRGFGSRQAGDRIIALLEELRFEVVTAIDGREDSLGGLIETHIAAVEELEIDDVEEIKDRIYRAADDLGVFCQVETFKRLSEEA